MNPHLIGMAGVYYVAAELSRQGYIVSMTARNARGPDLLVMDQDCRNAWSVQVKTNAKKRNSWSLGREHALISFPTYLFVFVTLNGSDRPDYMVVSSEAVVANKKGKTRLYFNRGDGPTDEGWDLFGKTALHELTWEGAREAARNPKYQSTKRLEQALALLKPPKDNKLDRGRRKAIEAELKLRSAVEPKKSSSV